MFDTVTTFKRLRELRLMNEIVDIRRPCCTNEIGNIAWICSNQNVADNLTRIIGNDILWNAMETKKKLPFTME